VVVWWVVLTVVVVGVEVGAVWWVGSRPGPATWNSTMWLVWREDRTQIYNSDFTVQALSPLVVRACVRPQYLDLNWVEPPPIVWTSDDSLDALSDGEIDALAPDRADAARRLRDVLGAIRRVNGMHANVHALDVSFGLPIGMYVHGESGGLGGHPQHSVPSGIRAAYPVVLTLEPQIARVLLHRDAIVIAASVSALLVGVGIGLGGARRARRVRQGRCAWCGYSLVGIAGDAVCPECGEGREREAKSSKLKVES
jgi:hypothetical protein